MMSNRSPRVPSPPTPPEAPSNSEWQRYLLRLRGWFAGELLRALAAHIEVQDALGAVPADYPLPAMTANYASLGVPGSSVVSDQMAGLLRYIDEDERIYVPLRAAVLRIAADRPACITILWRKHVLLETIPRIAHSEGCSERTVQYLLATGNAAIFAAYCRFHGIDGRLKKLGTTTERTLRDLLSIGMQLDAEPEATLEELALAGVG